MVRSLAYSPDGQLLATVETVTPDPLHTQYVVRLRQVSTGNILRTFGGQPEMIYALAFSHNGQLVAIGDHAARVQIWQVHDGRLLGTLTGHTDPIQQVVFRPDDTTIFSVSEDHTIREWQLHDGTLRMRTVWSRFYT